MFWLFLSLSFIFISLSGICESIMDKLNFHYGCSIFGRNKKTFPELFWNSEVSWKNKYKCGDIGTPKFLGSTTIFVFCTDGWHLFKFFRNVFALLSTGFAVYTTFFIPECITLAPLLYTFCLVLILRGLYSLLFNIFFDFVL
jgi:hypothetical protein|tara:strand:+ start:1455 stop:1880 length:426 start_codon:yes stop_codon:yes gene_type:complete